MEYKIEKWEAMDLLMHARDFQTETSEAEIPKFWDEYYANDAYKKIPAYLAVCALLFSAMRPPKNVLIFFDELNHKVPVVPVSI